MIRAAAKNAAWVAVVTDPATTPRSSLRCAKAASRAPPRAPCRQGLCPHRRLRRGDRRLVRARGRTTSFPSAWSSPGALRERLRYGENPHQSAALYLTAEPPPNIATARQVQGKELSYNNINDADAAFELVSDLPADAPAVVIIKHANPCGAAVGDDLAEAYEQGAPLRSRLRLWRHRRGEPAARRGGCARRSPASSPRWSSRRTPTRPRSRSSQESRTCACSSPAAWPNAGAQAAAHEERRGRAPGAGARQPVALRATCVASSPARAPSEREMGGPALRLPRRQAREVERHRLRQGRRNGRHRRRADEPRRLGADRGESRRPTRQSPPGSTSR